MRKEKGRGPGVREKLSRFFGGIYELHIFRRLIRRNEKIMESEGIEKNKCSKISACFGMCGTVCAFVLVVFTLLALLIGRNTVTVDNIYYLFKDVYSMNTVGESEITRLSYSLPASKQDFTLYKKGLAVAGDSEIKLFNSTGRVTLTLGSEFANPRILSSDRFVLVYDMGGDTFSVYNSFKQLYTETLDYNISTAATARNGRFAIVSGGQNYRSVISVYDSDFEKIADYSKNDYVISVSFDSSGRYIAVLSLDSENGGYVSRLSVFDTEKSEIRAQTSVDGVLAYECVYSDGDRIFVPCADRVLIFDGRCSQRGEFLYPGGSLSFVSVSDGGVALLFEDDPVNSQNTLYVIDKNGGEIFSHDCTGDFYDMEYYDRYVYLLEADAASRIDVRDGGIYFSECDGALGCILVSNQDKIMICTSSNASVIDSWARR